MSHNSQLATLDLTTLGAVTGGAARVTARGGTDPALTQAMTQIKSDLEGLVTASKSSSSSSMQTMLPMMMMMMRR
jgi:hypothetical protein